MDSLNVLDILIVVIMGMVAASLLTYIEIPLLRKHQFKQYIREEGPESHLKKQGTPTMGGIAIMIATVIATSFAGHFSKNSVVMMIVMVLYGLMGFSDDYIKVAKKHNEGLTPIQKIVIQIVIALVAGIYTYFVVGTEVYIPFAGVYADLGWLFIPFSVLVMVAITNSVNLTDGLDGLSSGVTAIVALFFAYTAMILGKDDVMTFSGVITGSCLGFLVFNRHPAKLFMGDTGSMALGGAIGVISLFTKMEFMLIIAGGIYVMESLSVIIQVTSFKLTGKRVFKMAPLHHHFEMIGMKEQNVVRMFWLITAILCALAWLSFRF